MAIITEDVIESADGTETMLVALDVGIVDNGSEATGTETLPTVGWFDGSTGAASDTAAPSASYVFAAADAASAADNLTLGFTSTIADAADGADTAAFAVDTPISDTANATDTAAPQSIRNASLAELATATDTVGIVVSLDVTDTANATDAMSVALDVSIQDAADASTDDAPHGAVTAQETATADATATEALGLVAVCELTERASARDHVMLDEGAAYWTGLHRMAAAMWSGVPFDSYAVHEGTLIAAGPAGIYAFNAEDDAGTPIAARVEGDLTDFGSPYRKRLGPAYAAAITRGPVRLRVTTEGGSWAYDFRRASAQLSNLPFDLGRGLNPRFVRFEFSNPGGSAFDVRDVVVNVADTNRMR